jgi:DNA repair photolyase
MIAPVIPGLTDHEIPAILRAAGEAGATAASYVPLRLPWGVSVLFDEWLSIHAPEKKARILNRIREIRGGRLNDPDFTTRMSGEGPYAEHIEVLFQVASRKAGLNSERFKLSTEAFRKPGAPQMRLFE